MAADPKASVASRLLAALKALRVAADDDRELRTQLLRQVAELSVDLREHFQVAGTGSPDWAGRSWPYRDYVRNLYSDAGYTAEEAKMTQASVRYHVGNIVRTKLGAEELEDLGLREESPVDRAREQREARNALISAATESDTSADVTRAIAAALLVLQPISAGDVAALDETGRSQAATLLGRITRRAAELTRAAGGAGTD